MELSAGSADGQYLNGLPAVERALAATLAAGCQRAAAESWLLPAPFNASNFDFMARATIPKEV
jgi:hypothetical protein